MPCDGTGTLAAVRRALAPLPIVRRVLFLTLTPRSAQIIPRAIDFFTGKALDYEDFDEDDEDDYEDLDEDDEDDDEDSEVSLLFFVHYPLPLPRLPCLRWLVLYRPPTASSALCAGVACPSSGLVARAWVPCARATIVCHALELGGHR